MSRHPDALAAFRPQTAPRELSRGFLLAVALLGGFVCPVLAILIGG